MNRRYIIMQTTQYCKDTLDYLMNSIREKKAAHKLLNPQETTFKNRYSFSAMGHIAALDKIYKPYFGSKSSVVDITGENSQMDTMFGVDYIVEAKNVALKTTVDLWVQERFRNVCFQKYQDITIIEYNLNSDHLSEVYKSKAQLMVYGYLSDNGVIQQAIIVDFAAVLTSIALDKINFGLRPNPNTNQMFLHIKFSDLRAAGLVRFEYNINS